MNTNEVNENKKEDKNKVKVDAQNKEEEAALEEQKRKQIKVIEYAKDRRTLQNVKERGKKAFIPFILEYQEKNTQPQKKIETLPKNVNDNNFN